MYTFQPIPPVSDGHFGLYCFTVIVGVILFGVIQHLRDNGWSAFAGTFLTIVLCLWGFVGYVSYNTSDAKTYVNAPVTAKFVQYVPEQQKYSCAQGKIQSTCYTSKMYAQFEVDGGMIIMEVDGQCLIGQCLIPPLVQMYRN